MTNSRGPGTLLWRSSSETHVVLVRTATEEIYHFMRAKKKPAIPTLSIEVRLPAQSVSTASGEWPGHWAGNILTGSANRDIKTTTGGLISGTHLDTSMLTELSVARVLHKRKVSGTGDGNR